MLSLQNILPKRKYKSGTGWCLWRWSDIETGHIGRLHIVKTPWFAVCLHWLNGPDPDPWTHDHPVSFLSIVLKGRYYENRNGLFKCRKWFNWIPASDKDSHRIISTRPGTVTLCFMGPKVREWGFHTDRGWVHWKEYYSKVKNCNLKNTGVESKVSA